MRTVAGWTSGTVEGSLAVLHPNTQKQRSTESAASARAASEERTLKMTRWRWWGFRLAAMLGVPVLLLLLAEGGLRLAGYGYSPHFFLPGRVESREVWIDNQKFGRRFFPPGLIRYPHPLTLPAVKPPNTLRIFVLGESAAMGDPDVKFGLPRMLEVMLRERYPTRPIEVVNAAMVAINSHVVLPIARDCVPQQGDLWVVYMGNNEMIGPFGSTSVFGAQTPALSLVRAGLWAKTMRLGQLMDGVVHSIPVGKAGPQAWGGMEMMAHLKVHPDAPATAKVYRHFERNLADLLATANRAGIPVVLCTVATNLKDCAPFASLHRAGLASADLARWQTHYETGLTCLNRSNLLAAKAAFERAAQIDSTYAELTFRHAECCRLLGLEPEAAKLYCQARDQDALQFRADSRINGLIRSAAARAAENVTLVDAEATLATNSLPGLTGAEHFYEHVHLTPEGNFLVARAIAEGVARTLALETSGQWLSPSECLQRLGLTDWNRYEALAVILDRIQGAPFTNQVNYAEELRSINAQLAHYRSATKPAQVKRELQQVSKLVARYPEEWDLRWNFAGLLEGAGDLAGSEAQWRSLLVKQPQAALPYINLAKLLERANRPTEAYSFYHAGLKINPEYYPARFALGSLCLRLDRVSEAILHLKQTIRQKPEAVEPRLTLSQALIRAHRVADAQTQLREVLRLDPNNAPAQTQLRELSGISDRP